jgi:hypothetical protein
MRHHLFAVLQRPQEHVHIHELNLRDGHLINDLKLEQAKANQTFLCGTTTTLYDKNSEKELFAIGLQSGLIFIIDTNPLQIHSIINGKYFFFDKISFSPSFFLNSCWITSSDYLVAFIFINRWLYLINS